MRKHSDDYIYYCVTKAQLNGWFDCYRNSKGKNRLFITIDASADMYIRFLVKYLGFDRGLPYASENDSVSI